MDIVLSFLSSRLLDREDSTGAVAYGLLIHISS